MVKILSTKLDSDNAEYFASIDDIKRANEAIEAVAVITQYNNKQIHDALED